MDSQGRKVIVCDNGTGVSTTPHTVGKLFNKHNLPVMFIEAT